MYEPSNEPDEALKGPALVPECPPADDAPLVIDDAALARRLTAVAKRLHITPSALVDRCLKHMLGES